MDLPVTTHDSSESVSSYPDSVMNRISFAEVKDILLSELHAPKDHPFKVDTNSDSFHMLVASIQENGVITPGIVCPDPDGGYTLLSGNRRKEASSMLGLDKMRAYVVDVDDDEKKKLIVDSNIYREKILPSEKVRAYTMRYNAAKHQGKSGGRTLTKLSKELEESEKQIQRYVSLSTLCQDGLDLLDEKKIPMTTAMKIAQLPESQQMMELEKLRAEKKEKTHCYDNVVFKVAEIADCFPLNTDTKEMKATILTVIREWAVDKRVEELEKTTGTDADDNNDHEEETDTSGQSCDMDADDPILPELSNDR